MCKKTTNNCRVSKNKITSEQISRQVLNRNIKWKFEHKKMPTAFVCLWHSIYAKGYWIKKKYPTNLIPFNLSSVLDVVILFAVHCAQYTHSDSGREPHTSGDHSLYFFSPRSLSNKIGNRNNNNTFL